MWARWVLRASTDSTLLIWIEWPRKHGDARPYRSSTGWHHRQRYSRYRVCTGARIVAQPDAKVLHVQKDLLQDAFDRDDLTGGLLNFRRCRRKYQKRDLTTSWSGGKMCILNIGGFGPFSEGSLRSMTWFHWKYLKNEWFSRWVYLQLLFTKSTWFRDWKSSKIQWITYL